MAFDYYILMNEQLSSSGLCVLIKRLECQVPGLRRCGLTLNCSATCWSRISLSQKGPSKYVGHFCTYLTKHKQIYCSGSGSFSFFKCKNTCSDIRTRMKRITIVEEQGQWSLYASLIVFMYLLGILTVCPIFTHLSIPVRAQVPSMTHTWFLSSPFILYLIRSGKAWWWLKTKWNLFNGVK